jgi:hypothetical protein
MVTTGKDLTILFQGATLRENKDNLNTIKADTEL